MSDLNPAGISEFDLGWLVGFYEGEGSCRAASYQKFPRTVHLQVRIKQKDIEPLLKLRDILGCGVIKQWKHGPGYIHEWMAYSSEALRFIDLLLPHVSERRRAQLQAAKDRYETRGRRGDWSRTRGSKRSPGQLRLMG